MSEEEERMLRRRQRFAKLEAEGPPPAQKKCGERRGDGNGGLTRVPSGAG